MAVPAALLAATLNPAVAGLPVYHHRVNVAPNADLLTSAQNLAAALIATGLVDNPSIIIAGQTIVVPPPAVPPALKYNDAVSPPTLINPATDI
jgi:hypothetical protein